MLSEKEYERQFNKLYPWSWYKSTEHNTHKKKENDEQEKTIYRIGAIK